VETHDDHRIAMAAAVLACAAGPVAIDSDASIDVSFPDFLSTLAKVRS
jgi:5-enolpyruvylshikimate-3-phosphate synthase